MNETMKIPCLFFLSLFPCLVGWGFFFFNLFVAGLLGGGGEWVCYFLDSKMMVDTVNAPLELNEKTAQV